MLNDMDSDIQYENMGKYMRINTDVDVNISATGNIMRLMGLYTLTQCMAGGKYDLSTQNSFSIQYI